MFRTSFCPDEAEPPLGVHPDTLLSATIPDQPFQTVARRNPKVLDIPGGMD
jgi:hypothetical protein